ncbi:MAG: MarR family transcriptional regulator [Proteobacteria bacterium]|nr:MarR family transcriptional regulator [Pseudomonadota bacterium]MCP4916601.1 MarR family transcriptional regulator [Pseudomonadota bacterium]
MSGRILGWLLICDPAQQSAAQIGDVLSASKASISTNARLLVQAGLITRSAMPGKRGAHYQIREGCWSNVLEFKFAATTAFRKIAEDGLEAIGDASPERRARLEEVHSLYSFFERELPSMMERWRTERDAKKDTA